MSNTLITKKGRNQKHDIIEEVHAYNICLDTREIYIHGESVADEGDSGVEFRMANRFLKNIRFLEAAGDDPIIVHQHSVGGEWADGMMIYDLIIHCQCHIIFVMHGTACSMGSIIPQAADTRIIMPSCQFMVHDGYTDIDGGLTYKQSRSWSNMEAKTRDIMMDIYSGVCVQGHYFQKEQADEKSVQQYITAKMDQKEDWWLFAREAVAYGFADAVLGDEGYATLEQIRDSIYNE